MQNRCAELRRAECKAGPLAVPKDELELNIRQTDEDKRELTTDVVDDELSVVVIRVGHRREVYRICCWEDQFDARLLRNARV
jgi:hypothetical protein